MPDVFTVFLIKDDEKKKQKKKKQSSRSRRDRGGGGGAREKLSSVLPFFSHFLSLPFPLPVYACSAGY